MKILKGMKIIGVVCKRGASRHSNRLERYGIRMEWKYNRAMTEDRKNLACHPLDRNRFEFQGLEGLDERKGYLRWINWEVDVSGNK